MLTHSEAANLKSKRGISTLQPTLDTCSVNNHLDLFTFLNTGTGVMIFKIFLPKIFGEKIGVIDSKVSFCNK
jgi:hypothetical protein